MTSAWLLLASTAPLAAFCAWVLVGVYELLRDEWEAKRKDDDR